MRVIVKPAVTAPPAPAFTHNAILEDEDGNVLVQRLGFSEHEALVALRGALRCSTHRGAVRLVVAAIAALPVGAEVDS